MSGRKIRALVIDDSAFNRRALSEILQSAADVEVIGRAADGEEGLRLALELDPDVITLDLEMPRMDGFTFLRLLMSRRPVPVVVVSSYARKANVFRALELGAVDFVAKPSRFITEDAAEVRDELISKIRTVRALRQSSLSQRPQVVEPPPLEAEPGRKGPMRIVTIGASTGGPPALQGIMSVLPAGLNAGLVIAQHMPPRFTRAFAERLDRTSALHVREAEEGDRVEAGVALVAPGGKRMEVVRDGSRFVVRLTDEIDHDAYVPSIDALFASVAEVAGSRALGIVLTGMGRDGKSGISLLKAAGAVTLAESEATSVVYGMPKEAAATGHVDKVLALGEIPAAIVGFVEQGTLPR